MARSWLIDGRTIASKVKNPTRACAYLIKDNEAKRECPNCHYFIDNNDVCHEWPGLPAGVKFDPSDAEILEHLAAKCGVGDLKPHPFIDDYIPTLLEDGGICYTHPENLPGVRKDGSSAHFFHRTINAYATGQRKRRIIYNGDGPNQGPVRWHKTGRTKPVIENGVHKGCKKIMVLYKSSKKGSKPDKANWVMHQYHLGRDEDEKEGEFVVSKIFYQQQKHVDAVDDVESLDLFGFHGSPRTPNPNPPNPPRPQESDALSPFETKEVVVGVSGLAKIEEEMEYPEAWLAGESQAEETTDLNGFDNSLLSNNLLNSEQNNVAFSSIGQTSNGVNTNDNADTNTNNNNAGFGIEDLESFELGTPPYSLLPDLQISSQDSIFGWIDDRM